MEFFLFAANHVKVCPATFSSFFLYQPLSRVLDLIA